MATPSNAERTRAARIRKKQRDGKPIAPEAAAWFKSYEARTTIAKAKALPSSASYTPTAAPRPVKVHKTAPDDGMIDTAGNTWEPVATAAAEGAEPLPPGSAPPPKPGSPVIDAPPAPVDTAAADQLATLVTFLVSLGVRAGLEMVDEAEIPDEVKALVGSPDTAAGALKVVHDAAHRLAVKYGVTDAPMPDELVVAAALLGSGALVFRQVKRKRLAATKAKAAAAPQVVERQEPPTPKSAIDSLYEER